MTLPAPLFILGLDGFDPELVSGWLADSSMAGLARVHARGHAGRLRSTVNQMTSSAWPTIATGCGPGMHGQFNFQERVPGEYRMRLSTSRQRRLPAFWELAEAAGMRSATVRVPMTFPVRETAGLAVSAWLCPSPETPGFCWPPALSPDLVRRFGRRFWLDYTDVGKARSLRGYRRLLRELLAGIDNGFELIHFVLDRGRFDLVYAVVRECDIAAHAFWHLADAGHPRHDPDLARHLGDAIGETYARVAAGIGALLDRLGEDWNVVILSDHGVGPNTLGSRCVAPLLEAAGLTRRLPAASPGPLQRLRTSLVARIPWHIRRRLRPIDEARWEWGFTQELLGGIDFARSQVFPGPSPKVGEIWLNLKGREPNGIVEPGPGAKRLIRQVSGMLMDAVVPESGEKPVVAVRRRGEACPGPNNQAIPDLLVVFREGLHVPALKARTPDGHEIVGAVPAEDLARPPGFHSPWAHWAAVGPDIARTSDSVTGTLEDVAPTVLALEGVPIPSYMEGRVLEGALAAHVSASHADVRWTDVARVADGGGSADSEAAVARRLQDLGYL